VSGSNEITLFFTASGLKYAVSNFLIASLQSKKTRMTTKTPGKIQHLLIELQFGGDIFKPFEPENPESI
jgi:hypothetical protein